VQVVRAVGALLCKWEQAAAALADTAAQVGLVAQTLLTGLQALVVQPVVARAVAVSTLAVAAEAE